MEPARHTTPRQTSTPRPSRPAPPTSAASPACREPLPATQLHCSCPDTRPTAAIAPNGAPARAQPAFRAPRAASAPIAARPPAATTLPWTQPPGISSAASASPATPRPLRLSPLVAAARAARALCATLHQKPSPLAAPACTPLVAPPASSFASPASLVAPPAPPLRLQHKQSHSSCFARQGAHQSPPGLIWVPRRCRDGHSRVSGRRRTRR